MSYKILGLASVLLLSSPVFAAGSEEIDHPMISAYPNAELRRVIKQDYEPFTFSASIINTKVKPVTFTPIETKGDLWRGSYTIKDVSTLKVYENYVAAAKKLGFTTVFSCQLESCGDDSQATEIGERMSPNESVYNYHSKPYYLLAEKQMPKGKTYAAWFIGAYESEVGVQQVISDAQTLDAGLIKVDAAYLSKNQNTTPVETAKAEELARDHKLLARYPGASLSKAQHSDTEPFVIPVAPNAEDKTPLNLTGDLTRHFYTIKDVSSLKVFENYKQAIAKAGFTIVSKCELAECGNENTMGRAMDKIAVQNSVYNYFRKPYYLVAKKAAETGDIYVAIFAGAYESDVGVQQIILQTKSVETGLIKVNADTLKQQIDADGKALIYGIYFDTGKAAVKPESKPTLDAIAQLLTKNKDLLLYVVGHTDDTGAGAANLELSRQRATAVVNELVTTYKVPATRLQAQGVGPYAPAGNNTSDAGKQKNRRVELVKRLQ